MICIGSTYEGGIGACAGCLGPGSFPEGSSAKRFSLKLRRWVKRSFLGGMLAVGLLARGFAAFPEEVSLDKTPSLPHAFQTSERNVQQPGPTPSLPFNLTPAVKLAGGTHTNVKVLSEPNAAEDSEEKTLEEEFLLLEGEGLTFTATVETSQQIRRVEKEEIRRLQAPDIPSLLERAFQVGITRNGPYGSVSGISLRGYGSGRVAILVDGVPVNSTQTGVFDLNRISPEDIEGIEVIYGGSDTKFAYSGAQGGIVNLITRRQKGEGVRWETSFINQFPFPEPYVLPDGERGWPPLTQFLDTQKLHLLYEGTGERGGLKASVEAVQAQNKFLFQDPTLKIRQREGSEVKDLKANLSYLREPESRLTTFLISGSLYWADKKAPGPLYSTNPGEQQDLFGKASIHYQRRGIGEKGTSLDGIVTYLYEGTNWEDVNGTTTQKLHTLQAIHRWEIPLSSEVLFRPSLDGTFSYLDSSNLSTQRKIDGGGALGVEYFPTAKMGIFPYLKLIVTQTTIFPIPKLGILWHASEEVTVKHNWYRTFRLPTLNDLYWPEDNFARGNPDLKPEDGIGADFILEWKKPEAFQLDSSFYVTYQKDAITWQPASGGKWTPVNLAEALYVGSDVRVVTDIHPQFKLTASYGWLLTYVLTGNLTLKDDKRMPYQPIHRLGFGVDVLWSTGSVVVSARYESERYATIVNAAPLAPYFTLDVSVTQRLGSAWTLLLSGTNLLGANYQLIENYPLPRTLVSVGLKYTYKEGR